MKKIFRNLTLALVVAFSLITFAGCKKDSGGGGDNNKTPEVTKQEAVVNPVVSDGDYYEGLKLSTVLISLSEGDTAGVIAWANPDELLKTGENEYSYKFTPEDVIHFKEKTGKVSVSANAQTLEKIEVKTAPAEKTYQAFQRYDTTDLVLTLVYNKGKTVDVTTGFTVKYLGGDSLRAGDTKVVISYEGKETELAIKEVEKIELAKPSISGTYTYTGSEQTANLSTLANSDKYTISGNKQTNAGSYNVVLSLIDFANYKWISEESKDLVLTFVINKADLVVAKNNYSGTYDKQEHSAYVSSEFASKIYYSLSQLNETNFSSGSEAKINFINATAETNVYYYAVGDDNHNDASGFVTVNIGKANVTISAKYCYTIEVSGKTASLPTSYVSVVGLEDELIDTNGKLTFGYYTNYEDKILTNSSNGATIDGGAPVNSGRYFVETTFSGNENYNTARVTSLLVVDIPNLTFFTGENEDEFAWFDAENKTYFEFMIDSSEELAKLVFIAKVDGKKISGYLWLANGAYSAYVDGSEKVYVVSTDADANNLSVVSNGEETRILPKFVLPEYVGEYECDNLQDGEHVNSLVITNDYGDIVFTLDSWYKKSGSTALAEKHYEGVVGKPNPEKDGTYSLSFTKIDGSELYFSIFDYVPGNANSFVIEKTTPFNIKGTYNRK